MRSVRVEYLSEGVVGTLYKVIFIDEGIAVGHWPINGEGLGGLVSEWIRDGKRPQ